MSSGISSIPYDKDEFDVFSLHHPTAYNCSNSSMLSCHTSFDTTIAIESAQDNFLSYYGGSMGDFTEDEAEKCALQNSTEKRHLAPLQSCTSANKQPQHDASMMDLSLHSSFNTISGSSHDDLLLGDNYCSHAIASEHNDKSKSIWGNYVSQKSMLVLSSHTSKSEQLLPKNEADYTPLSLDTAFEENNLDTKRLFFDMSLFLAAIDTPRPSQCEGGCWHDAEESSLEEKSLDDDSLFGNDSIYVTNERRQRQFNEAHVEEKTE